MSIFSVIKRGRQQAKERARKQADAKEKGAENPPYKHVPTHAAQDALSSAPPMWRLEDRPRILEQNRRRAANDINTVIPGQYGAPRFSSGLSNVMYPSAHASPLVSISRSHSRNEGTVYLAWPYRHADPVSCASGETSVPSLPSISSLQEKDAEGPPLLHPTRSSSSASKGSLAGMDSDSDSPGIHRLHPSRPRRWSDGSETSRAGHSSQRKHPQALTSSRDSRPPPSMRGFNAIPPPPAFPPMQIPSHLYHSSSTLSSSTASTVSTSSSSSTHSSASHSQSSSTTASTSSSTTSSPLRTTPIIPSATDFVFPFMSDSRTATPPNRDTSNSTDKQPSAEAVRPQPQGIPSRPTLPFTHYVPTAPGLPTNAHVVKHRDTRVPKTTRFSELETILPNRASSFSNTSAARSGSLERKYSAPPQLSNEVISRALSRQSGPASPVEAIAAVEEPKSKGKLIKSRPSKLSKKRWSTGNSPPVVVA